jgi:hypothetical protein
VRGYDDRLDGAALFGFGQGGAQQPRAGRRPVAGRRDHEVVDIAREAAGIVNRRRRVEGRDKEPGQLARFFTDQADDLIAGHKAAKVGAVPIGCGGGRPPEQRLVARVLLAPDARQGRHGRDIGLRCGAYLLTHPSSVARFAESGTARSPLRSVWWDRW